MNSLDCRINIVKWWKWWLYWPNTDPSEPFKGVKYFVHFRKFDLSICSSGCSNGSHAFVHCSWFSWDYAWDAQNTSRCKLHSFMFMFMLSFSRDLKLIYWIIYLWAQQKQKWCVRKTWSMYSIECARVFNSFSFYLLVNNPLKCFYMLRVNLIQSERKEAKQKRTDNEQMMRIKLQVHRG